MKTLVFAFAFVVLLLLTVVPALASNAGSHISGEAAFLATNPEISTARHHSRSATTSQRSRDAATACYNALAEN